MLQEHLKQTISAAYKAILAQQGFRSRLGQRVMIAEIAKTLSTDESRLVVAEAPTGTGKSLAYLTAGVPLAQATGKKLVIATSTVALQEQIARKDLPRFLATTEMSAKFVVAKGRGRYLCPVKLSAKTGYGGRQGDLFGMNATESSRPEQVYQAMIDALDAGTWDGDRDAFSCAVSDELWSPLTMDRGGCLGNACRFRTQCPALMARARIESSEVVVANHDLLLSDLAMGGGAILPVMKDAIVVIDEAHSLPHRARVHFGGQVSFRALSRGLTSLNAILGGVDDLGPGGKGKRKKRDSTQDARDAANTLSRMLAEFQAVLDRGIPKSLADITASEGKRIVRFRRGIVPSELAELSGLASESAKGLAKLLEKIAAEVKSAIADGRANHATAEAMAGRLGEAVGQVDRARSALASFAEGGNEDGPLVARWIETRNTRDGLEHTLEHCPTDVSGLLRGLLWNEAYGAVVTSATLTALGRFEHFRREAGLPYEPGAVYLKLASPFDHSRARISVPGHASADPSDAKSHTEYVALSLPDLIEETGGTLVLFASRKQLQEVRERMSDEVRQVLLCQDEMPRPLLLEEHARRIGSGLPSVIFGLASFAEGVDLPGDLCRHVVIAKLPFDPPDSPAEATLAEAIEARGGNVFQEIVLPKASVKLVQAAGRLLRTEDDSGSITILDSRLRTKRYGPQLLRHLPGKLVNIPR